VTLTSCAGKIYERLLKLRLETHLEEKHIFADNQSAYRKGRGTWNNLIDLISDLQDKFQRGFTTTIVFPDLKKAFDSVEHAFIIDELQKAETPPFLIKVITSYLSNRRIISTVDKVTSLTRRLNRGVPQGGVLSLTLFNIVLAPLRKLMDDSINMSVYADDIAIWSSTAKAFIKLEKDLSKALNGAMQFLDARGLSYL